MSKVTKEELINLGLSEDLAIKAAEASQNELKDFIPKSKFDEAIQAKEQLEKDIQQRDKQLETLSNTVGDSEELKAQIKQLQQENKLKEEEHTNQIRELIISNAIKSTVSATAQDIDLVSNLFDKSKLILSDDNKVVGIEEQFKELQKTKPFLFKTGEMKTIYEPKGGTTSEPSLAASIAKQMNNEDNIL